MQDTQSSEISNSKRETKSKTPELKFIIYSFFLKLRLQTLITLTYQTDDFQILFVGPLSGKDLLSNKVSFITGVFPFSRLSFHLSNSCWWHCCVMTIWYWFHSEITIIKQVIQENLPLHSPWNCCKLKIHTQQINFCKKECHTKLQKQVSHLYALSPKYDYSLSIIRLTGCLHDWIQEYFPYEVTKVWWWLGKWWVRETQAQTGLEVQLLL